MPDDKQKEQEEKDEKFTSKTRVTVTIPKSVFDDPKQAVQPPREGRRYGPFSITDDDLISFSPGKIRVMDISSESKVKNGYHNVTHDVEVPVILGAVSYDNADATGDDLSYADQSDAEVLRINRALLQQRFHPDNKDIRLTDSSPVYRTFAGNWPLPWEEVDPFDVTVAIGSESHLLTPGAAWKDGHDTSHADSEAYGYVDTDPPAPPAAFTPRPVSPVTTLSDPPVEPNFSTAFPFGTLYEEAEWKQGQVRIKKMKNEVAVKTNSVFYEPFSTSDTTNYKVTEAETDGVAYYEATEVPLMQLGKDEFDIWLVPQTWKFDLTWVGEVLFMWSSRNYPVVNPGFFVIAQLGLLASLPGSGWPPVAVGQMMYCQGISQDRDEQTGEILRIWQDTTEGYYYCGREPGFDAGDWVYLGGRPHRYYPAFDYVTNEGLGYPAHIDAHDIPQLAISAVPFELQKCRTGSKQIYFSVSGYKKAQTKPIFPRQRRLRTETPDVRRVIGDAVAGMQLDPGVFHVNPPDFTGKEVDTYDFHYNGPYFTTGSTSFSPTGDAYNPNPDSVDNDFNFDEWSYSDFEYELKTPTIPATSLDDIRSLCAWVESSVAYINYMSSAYATTWAPTSQYYNQLAATVDPAMATPHTSIQGPSVRTYGWANNVFAYGGPWRSYNARFTITQVNTPAKSLVGCVATRNADGTIKDKRYIWRKTASAGRNTKVVDNQPFDSVFFYSESDSGRFLRSAAKGNWDPAGAVEHAF